MSCQLCMFRYQMNDVGGSCEWVWQFIWMTSAVHMIDYGGSCEWLNDLGSSLESHCFCIIATLELRILHSKKIRHVFCIPKLLLKVPNVVNNTIVLTWRRTQVTALRVRVKAIIVIFGVTIYWEPCYVNVLCSFTNFVHKPYNLIVHIRQ